MCPKNPPKLTQLCVIPFKSENCISVGESVKMSEVKVNGKSVKALIDTGSVQTLVDRELVPSNIICTSDTILIRCVHGDERQYPTADMYIEVQGQLYLLNVGVAENLPFPVVLGSDLPVLFDLLHKPQNCNVVTRSQAKKPEESPAILSVLPFYDADLDVQPGKSRKSRRQKRREKFLHTPVASTEGVQDLPQGFKMPLNIAQIQRDDSSLAALFLKAKEPQKGNHRGSADEFVLQKNILYRQQGAFRQLVVPRDARGMVLTLGHSIPWAGHLGTHKTLARIKRHFYWPGLRTAVAQFCRTCSQCQLTSNKFPSRAPLQPLPLIDTPFERLGMDIVGPLERSKSGYRYMLVITDYATKYPEVFPLKTIKARAVAVSLVQHFSRVGFPCEIVTDQGTNFMSALLKQVYQLLGIKGVRTTPYHPQTDGLTERFNQTLKQMLQKYHRPPPGSLPLNFYTVMR
ncbi:protein NYNRIN-like [Xiphophorus hellerii]|uniref:protein NYNRIN-like n=1 Tax=Xiphophorus hellerii TaxID=8084 RepID=UPI0013B418C5|nr:protein NYNRIN-like [Xiphophorus hellerii]